MILNLLLHQFLFITKYIKYKFFLLYILKL